MKCGVCKDDGSNLFGQGNEVGFSEVANMKPPEGSIPCGGASLGSVKSNYLNSVRMKTNLHAYYISPLNG
jgi:hypothetical protein